MAQTPESPIVYVTRDIERALGMVPSPKYRIIANRTKYSESIKKQYPDFVDLVDAGSKLSSTTELMANDAVQRIISENKADLVVFKNTPEIERIAHDSKIHLLNPASKLAETIENKITQVEWLGELGKKYLIETAIMPASAITFEEKPLIIQWAHGHTGSGTTLINDKKTLELIQKKFPERLARVAPFVHGPTFTVNCVVTKNRIVIGNVSYQITGMAPFTDNMFSTIGNDWSLPHSLLDETETAAVEEMATEIGNRLRGSGWRGLFGMDIVRDEERDRLALIEINARQPASTTFESLLELENRKHGMGGQTIFESHINALAEREDGAGAILINDGAQIVQRITGEFYEIPEGISGALTLAGYSNIEYDNTELNSDLIRIQSDRGIMESHNKFNRRGKEILEIINNRP